MNEQPDTPDTPMLMEASDVTIESIQDYIARTLSAEEAGAIRKESAQTIRRLLSEGKIPGRKIKHPTKGFEMWRVEKTGLLADQAEGSTAMMGTIMGAADIAQLVRMWVEDRKRNEQLHEDNAKLREELAAERAKADLAMRLLSAPTEAPKPKSWWRLW